MSSRRSRCFVLSLVLGRGLRQVAHRRFVGYFSTARVTSFTTALIAALWKSFRYGIRVANVGPACNLYRASSSTQAGTSQTSQSCLRTCVTRRQTPSRRGCVWLLRFAQRGSSLERLGFIVCNRRIGRPRLPTTSHRVCGARASPRRCASSSLLGHTPASGYFAFRPRFSSQISRPWRSWSAAAFSKKAGFAAIV